MSRRINNGEHSWSNGKAIRRTDRPASDDADRVEVMSGGRTVTWPAHVKVQMIPGLERSAGQRADLYVRPSDEPGQFVQEWLEKRGDAS